MKKKFIIISSIILFLVVLAFILVEIFISRKYQTKLYYYTYLNVLIFISMILPVCLIIIACVYEGLKLSPEISFNKMISLVIFCIEGFLVYFITTNFIEFKHFEKFQIGLWILIPLLFVFANVISHFALKNKKDNNKPKIMKRQ